MKKIHVIATSKRRILTVACPSDIPGLLEEAEIIQAEWFYEKPDGLENFLGLNPDALQYFLQGFSDWIDFHVKGYAEKQNHYGELKKKIQKFSETLFEKLRGLATRIAKQVKKIIKPKKIVYEEERLQKKMYRNLTCHPIELYV